MVPFGSSASTFFEYKSGRFNIFDRIFEDLSVIHHFHPEFFLSSLNSLIQVTFVVENQSKV